MVDHIVQCFSLPITAFIISADENVGANRLAEFQFQVMKLPPQIGWLNSDSRFKLLRPTLIR